MVDWQHTLERKWPALRFGEVKVETDGGQHVFEVQVYLDDLDPEDAGIGSVRRRQIKNFLLTQLISRGVPMLLGGDEIRRTQGGNNNAYCQKNETSWYDWGSLAEHQEIYLFTQGMIAFRRTHPILSREQFYTDADIR